jgi:hypothetical protein
MKRWIEGLSRLEGAECNTDKFAHHGADDDHGHLAGECPPMAKMWIAESSKR